MIEVDLPYYHIILCDDEEFYEINIPFNDYLSKGCLITLIYDNSITIIYHYYLFI